MLQDLSVKLRHPKISTETRALEVHQLSFLTFRLLGQTYVSWFELSGYWEQLY